MIRFGNLWLFRNTIRMRPLIWRDTQRRISGVGMLGLHIAYARRGNR